MNVKSGKEKLGCLHKWGKNLCLQMTTYAIYSNVKEIDR